MYASTAARQGRVADLKPPGLRAEEVEPVVLVVLQQEDKLRNGVRVVPEEGVLTCRAAFVWCFCVSSPSTAP